MRTFECPACTFETRRFGRGRSYRAAARPTGSGLADDIRLFALTFAGGFLFVSLYLA